MPRAWEGTFFHPAPARMPRARPPPGGLMCRSFPTGPRAMKSTVFRPTVLAIALLAALGAGCGDRTAPTDATAASAASAEATAKADAAFADLSKRWLDGFGTLNPIYATSIGDHRYDTQVDDLSEAGRA